MKAFFGRTLTGAWIETPLYLSDGLGYTVAPSRARGLKPANKAL